MGKEGYMAIKLDMSKAYDRVEWAYVQAIMKKLAFVEEWIDLVMKCITSVSYEILINGFLGENLKPQKWLWQGNPLSLYL